jgi:hypothetical protein
MILGISGRKQSGKSTTANFIVSTFLAQLGVSKTINLDDEGRIFISDLFGDGNYTGLLDTSVRKDNDYMLNKLYSLLDRHVKIYSFADPLKLDICMNILGLTYEQCYGSDIDKNTLTDISWNDKLLTAREVMEVVGTDIFRKLKNDVWVSSTINRIAKDNSSLAIIPDCRFPNEIESIKASGGKVIRLTRNPFNSDAKAEVALDENNYDWSNFDYVCRNENMNIYEQCMDIQKFLQENLPL